MVSYDFGRSLFNDDDLLGCGSKDGISNDKN